METRPYIEFVKFLDDKGRYMLTKEEEEGNVYCVIRDTGLGEVTSCLEGREEGMLKWFEEEGGRAAYEATLGEDEDEY